MNFRARFLILIAAFLLAGTLWAKGTDEVFNTVPSDQVPFEFSTTGKVVMAGDIHGNLDALVAILRHSELVDKKGHWIGGKSIFVTPGDVLDGNKQSTLVVTYIVQLQKEAQNAGGDVITTGGNHELMVSEGDILHVTKKESKYYEDAEPGMHEKNSIHSFFDPETERGQWMRSLNQVVKIKQTWGGKSRTFIATHAGFDELALETPLSEYNSTMRAWIRYWQYKARTRRNLLDRLNDESLKKELKQEVRNQLKDLKNDKLKIVDELGAPVEKPPDDTAWVVGYDPKSRTFNETAKHSPSWARFNKIRLDGKTGLLITKHDLEAMTPEQLKAFLKKENADFIVVGHEPTPRNKKLKITREIRFNPRYPNGQVINLDTRIGWEADPEVGGTISYAAMENGKVTFINNIKKTHENERREHPDGAKPFWSSM